MIRRSQTTSMIVLAPCHNDSPLTLLDYRSFGILEAEAGVTMDYGVLCVPWINFRT